jgi:catechol 2,3-dioxygenase-like lactoylglutathione lyase family enzyme
MRTEGKQTPQLNGSIGLTASPATIWYFSKLIRCSEISEATPAIRADTLIVIRKGEVKPGATDFGTITIVVPSGRKIAERVVAAGYATARPIVDGTNFVKDPDGYTIELYQRPAAR